MVHGEPDQRKDCERGVSDTYLTLEYDALTRTTTTFHMDDAGHVNLRQHQDVQPILDANAQQRKLDRPRNGFRQVARIPDSIMSSLQRSWRARNLGWEEKQRELKAFLNDPKFKKFRTSEGVV